MAEQKSEAVMNKKLKIKVTTPRGIKFEESGDRVSMRCIDGELGVLPGHEPVTTVLGDGILRIVNNGAEKLIAIFGGIVEIDDTEVNIFTTIAQRPEEIDLERAQKDKEEAEAAIIERSDQVQSHKLQVMMRRSLVRIEVNLHLEDSDYFDVEDENE